MRERKTIASDVRMLALMRATAEILSTHCVANGWTTPSQLRSALIAIPRAITRKALAGEAQTLTEIIACFGVSIFDVMARNLTNADLEHPDVKAACHELMVRGEEAMRDGL